MKTAISVDDELLARADALAAEMGINRSRLFSVAMRDFIEDQASRRILESLNRAYGDGPAPAERRLVARMRGKFRKVIENRW